MQSRESIFVARHDPHHPLVHTKGVLATSFRLNLNADFFNFARKDGKMVLDKDAEKPFKQAPGIQRDAATGIA